MNQEMNRKASLTTIIIFALLCSFVVGLQTVEAAEANSRIIIVPDDYASIQEAINNANNGDTIFVKKGVYVENPMVNRSVSLVGENRDATIIDVTAGLKVEADNVTITGFTIYDGYDGISISSIYCNISGNKITNVKYGIVTVSASNNQITDNVIDLIEPYGYGIQLNYGSNNNVLRNRINSASIGIAIKGELLMQTSLSTASNNNISENYISNSEEHALMVTFANNNTFTANNLTNSGNGVSLFESDNNIFHHNNFINNTSQASTSLNEPYYNMTSSKTRSTIAIWDENYWSNYNNSDANGDGIGDIPYIINEKNADNHPRMTTFTASSTIPTLSTPTPTQTPTDSPNTTPISTIPSPSITPSNSPMQQSTQSPSPTLDNIQAENFTSTVIILSLVTIAVVVGLLVYFKKRRG